MKGYHYIAIREVSAVTTDISSPASVNVSVNIENLDIIRTTTCDLHFEFSLNGEVVNITVKSNVLLTSGYNYIDSVIKIENP